jgi:peptide/nickel transport system permease protein
MFLLRALARRVLILIATIVAGGLFSAMLFRYAPGFGSDESQLDARLSSESIRAIQKASEDQRSITSYYVGSLRRALHGDLGFSKSLQRPVRELLVERGAVTLRIVVVGLTTAWLVALAMILTTWMLGSAVVERACAIGSGLLLCIPAGAIALLLILMNGPGFGALALTVFPKVHCYLSNLVRATANMPHIVTAKAKGVGDARILLWHVVPVIRREALALAGASLALAVSAVIPVEALCGIPGVGQLAWQSAMARDLPLLVNISLIVVAITVLANTGADLLSDERRQLS